MDSGLHANRNKNDSKPATVAVTAGHGSRTGASGARLRGLRGMVRAQEFAGQGKCGEMNNPCQIPSPKPRDGEQAKFPQAQVLFFSCSLSRCESTHLGAQQRKLQQTTSESV